MFFQVSIPYHRYQGKEKWCIGIKLPRMFTTHKKDNSTKTHYGEEREKKNLPMKYLRSLSSKIHCYRHW
jgi:hypothetical protein